jgi:hypothetical protein
MKAFWRKYRRKFLLVCLGVVFGLLIIEGGLRLIAVLGPSQLTEDLKGLTEYSMPDDQLKVRIKPNAPGHDAWGFRNNAVPERVDVVTIGDSQTWGINAERQDAWPQKLEQISGLSVYNMALGYYGTVEYWVLVEKALTLSPDIVIIGLYLANDMWGAYQSVYEYEAHSQLRDDTAEASFGPDTIVTEYSEIRESTTESLSWIENSFITNFASFVRRHSYVAQLVWRIWENQADLRFKASSAWAEANPKDGIVYINKDMRMVLQPTYRLLATDLDNPRISEGLRITLEVIGYAKQEVEAAGAKLIVLLIPTQELAAQDVIQEDKGQLNANYTKLVNMETSARSSVIEYCEENDIYWVDPLPSLRQAISRKEVIYPPHADGHPFAAGYYIIANEVNEYLTTHHIVD